MHLDIDIKNMNMAVFTHKKAAAVCKFQTAFVQELANLMPQKPVMLM
jgi:hypothetical protein